MAAISGRIIMFYQDGDPECILADKAIEELYAENPGYSVITLMRVDDTMYPLVNDEEGMEVGHFPAFFSSDKGLLYHSFPGDTQEHLKKKIRAIFDLALD